MNRLKVLLAEIKAALVRGGSGAARREANQNIVRFSQQGIDVATETLTANEADFGRQWEEWHGTPPEPRTPREDPQHVSKACMGRRAEWFLLALKIVFWTVFGPLYFSVLAWLAVIVALSISVTMSLGIKPLLAGLILKPGLTPHEKERRLHAHLVAGVTAFAFTFGGLFVLRGLAGPLALIGALLVLPALSSCDLVLLYLMGIAHSFVQLYSWARSFVETHQAATAYRADFEHCNRAAQKRLDDSDGNASSVAVFGEPTRRGPDGAAAIPSSAEANRPLGIRGIDIGTAGMLLLALSFAGATLARAQSVTRVTTPMADLRLDSTASLFRSVADSMSPILVHAITLWVQQEGAQIVRVSTFERDGWLPRTIMEISRTATPGACASQLGERAIFRGMSEALEQQARAACNQAQATDAVQMRSALTKAISVAWHAPPLVKPERGRSCTALLDALAAAATAPAGVLIVIATDGEETCNSATNPVPDHAAGADVIIVLVPSKSDMGPGVSAAGRFTVKKARLQNIAPWLRAILAPPEVESYRLPMPPAATGGTKISFWQR
jgi:hypothetical protein